MAVDILGPTPAELTVQEKPTGRDRLGIPALVTATAISSTGNNLTAIAIPWFVYATTGSAAKTGLVAFAGLLPIIVAGLIGGLVVDRVGFKQSSVISDIISALTVAIIPTLYLFDQLQFWHLLVLAFAGAILDVPGSAARDSMIPQLAARVCMPLERANSARQLGLYTASFVGPLLAGFLIAAVGATSVLFIDSGSFIISAIIIGSVVHYRPQPRDRAADPGISQANNGVLSDALEGVRFLLRDPLLSTIVFISVFANFMFSPLAAVVFPVYVKTIFGNPQSLGYLIAAFGAGSIIGTLAFAALGPRLPRYPLIIGGLGIISLGLWFLPLAPVIGISITGALITGLALGPLNAVAMVVIQERVPEEMLGRVISSLIALAMLASPLGVLLAGFALEVVSSRLVLAGIATGFTLVALFALVNPALRTVQSSSSVSE